MMATASHAKYADVIPRLVAGEFIRGRELLRLRGLHEPQRIRASRTYKLLDAPVQNCVLWSMARLADEATPLPEGKSYLEALIRILSCDPRELAATDEDKLLLRAYWWEMAAAADLASGLGEVATPAS